MPRKPRTPKLETALTELEKLVQQLEAGSLTLENSLKLFERGVILSRQTQSLLQAAEQKVDILLEGEVQNLSIEIAQQDVQDVT
jgi:exodeoxyribonuclease VII small subunit